MDLPRDIIVATIISFKITRRSASPQRVHVLCLRSYWATRNGEFPAISDAQFSVHFHRYCIKAMSAKSLSSPELLQSATAFKFHLLLFSDQVELRVHLCLTAA